MFALLKKYICFCHAYNLIQSAPSISIAASRSFISGTDVSILRTLPVKETDLDGNNSFRVKVESKN